MFAQDQTKQHSENTQYRTEKAAIQQKELQMAQFPAAMLCNAM